MCLNPLAQALTRNLTSDYLRWARSFWGFFDCKSRVWALNTKGCSFVPAARWGKGEISEAASRRPWEGANLQPLGAVKWLPGSSANGTNAALGKINGVRDKGNKPGLLCELTLQEVLSGCWEEKPKRCCICAATPWTFHPLSFLDLRGNLLVPAGLVAARAGFVAGFLWLPYLK